MAQEHEVWEDHRAEQQQQTDRQERQDWKPLPQPAPPTILGGKLGVVTLQGTRDQSLNVLRARLFEPADERVQAAQLLPPIEAWVDPKALQGRPLLTLIELLTGPCQGHFGLHYNPHLMKLSIEEVRHVANLARLGLSEEELEAMATQLSTILEYIDKLEEIDTSAISPTAQVGELTDVMREDEVAPSLPQEAALKNAPAREGGYLRVRAMQE